MSRSKRMQNKHGPHENKYASDSRAKEVGEGLERKNTQFQEPAKTLPEIVLNAENPRAGQTEREAEKPAGLLGKILYVTDVPHKDAIRDKLESSVFGRFECQAVYAKEDAKREIEAGDYDCILIESLRIMSEAQKKDFAPENGLELVKYAKAKKLKVLLLAEDNLKAEDQARNTSADKFLRKPVSCDVVYLAVYNLLEIREKLLKLEEQKNI